MKQNQVYIGIDRFRLLAAFLIIAIHTGPLTSYNATADFLLTHIIARIAVPFFFVTSGFFLISRHTYDMEQLKGFLKKTGLLYLCSILLYLPINIYNDYFAMEYLLPNIIKDIIFDGTMYHLWYLPASMLGAIIAFTLVKKFGLRIAFAVASILYLIGLFGDSYYGLGANNEVIQRLYQALFQISDYTRNGIFFAPVFFVLGGVLRAHGTHCSTAKHVFGLLISLGLLLFEGLLLHKMGVQRHDSMYIMLLPCMYFLFSLLLAWRGKESSWLRPVALLMYIVHPLMIVIIRLLAKRWGQEALWISNRFVHYLLVSMASVLVSLGIAKLMNTRRQKRKCLSTPVQDRAWIEIHRPHLKHNIETLKKALPEKCQLMGVVKAEAYGHNSFLVSTCMYDAGVRAFAVAAIDEGIALRRYGIQGEILILGYTSPTRASELSRYHLTQTLIDYEYAQQLSRQGYSMKAHIKIDTGMHRLGFAVQDLEKIREIFHVKHLNITGMFTHLCVSDSRAADDIAFTHMQIRQFYSLLDLLQSEGVKLPKIHMQSSYGFLNYPALHCDYVRAGLAIYGILSSPDDTTVLQLDLKPVLSLKSQIILLRPVSKGDSVGYGRDFIASRDSQIAMLPIGYADGIPRNLSCGKTTVLIRGQRAPIIGKICMDQLAVDVTDILDVAIGDVVTFIGTDGDAVLSAEHLAQETGSITNELLSRLGRRLKVKVID